MRKVSLSVIAGLLLTSAVYWAHHGDAGRYEENVTVLTGTVVEVQLVDPHSIIILDVPNEKGQVVRWQAELGGRNALAKNFGWNKNTLKYGDRITITGRRVKSGEPYINLTEKANVVLTGSGKEIFRTPNYEPPAFPKK
jgi:DNA/RNA endonuclease YhcR with UshA esterase domain